MLQVSDVGRRQAGRPTWLGDCGTADRWHLVGDKQLTNQQEWLHRRCSHKRGEVAGASVRRTLSLSLLFFPLVLCNSCLFAHVSSSQGKGGKKQKRNTPVVVPL